MFERSWYCTLPRLKLIAGIASTDTREDALLKLVLKQQSDYIDRATGTHFYVGHATERFTARTADILRLPDFVRIVTLKTDEGANTYPNTWATTDYLKQPNDALLLSPPWPYDRLQITALGNYSFPVDMVDGVEITLDLGFYEVLTTLTTLATGGLTSGATSLATPTGFYEVGQTLKIEDEQLFVSAVATASPNDTVTLERGVNGTTAVAHIATLPVSLYTYPLIEEACQNQAHRAWRYVKSLGMGSVPNTGVPIPIRGLDPRAEEIINMFRIPGGLGVR